MVVKLKNVRGITLVALHGTGTQGGKSRIVNAFSKGISLKEKAEVVKNECMNYGYGSPIREPNKLFAVNFFRGVSYSYCDMFGREHKECKATWKELALEIERLISIDRYMSPKERRERV